MPAKAARGHLRDLVLGKKVGIRRITEGRYERTRGRAVRWGDERSAGNGRYWSR